MKTKYGYITVICLIAIMASGNLVAQQKPTRMRIEYFKNHNGAERVVATLRVKEKRYLPLSNALVHFYSLGDTSRTLLGKKATDNLGEASFEFDKGGTIYTDSVGLMTIEAVYKGNSENKGSKRKVTVQQCFMELSFFQKDTIKYIEVTVNRASSVNQPDPVENLKIMLYVKGTFSLLNFDRQDTDRDGRVRVEFPVDMPGDTAGVLTIVAKINEHKKYGTVESRGTINWGIPVPPVLEKRRGLGDTDAPLWMVYTLIILLSTVWFHYLYVIYLVIKIKLAKSSLTSEPFTTNG
jgi:hypothetical protein